MNHDASHCLDYKQSCPKSCYRAKLTEELKHIDYPLSVSWMHFKDTKERPKCGDEMTFEKILETENINEALQYLKMRQSTIKCIEIIKMLERILIRERK